MTPFLPKIVREMPADSEYSLPEKQLMEKEQANPTKLPALSSSTESLVLSLFLTAPGSIAYASHRGKAEKAAVKLLHIMFRW